MKQELLNHCARLFRVTPDDIMGRRRVKHIMMARYAMYAALRLRGWSYPAIGRFMQRDHTTTIVGNRQAQWYIERYPEYAKKVRELAALQPETLVRSKAA